MSKGKQKVLTFSELNEALHYDPDTGVVTARLTRGRWPSGRVVGSPNRLGYLTVNVCGAVRLLHRVIFVLMTGEWPSAEVDHINGDRSDNRWKNLRLATSAQQQQNITVKSHNMTGLLGVSWRPRKKSYFARIRVCGRVTNLGYFDTPEEAHQAYLNAKRELHTFQPTPRATRKTT